MLQSKSLRTTKDISNGAGKWTQIHKSYCSRWPARPQFNSPGWKQVRHFLYISLRDHLLFLCLTWLTWDHALEQAAEQITEHKLLEKLVQVANEKLSWKLFRKKLLRVTSAESRIITSDGISHVFLNARKQCKTIICVANFMLSSSELFVCEVSHCTATRQVNIGVFRNNIYFSIL